MYYNQLVEEDVLSIFLDDSINDANRTFYKMHFLIPTKQRHD